MVKYALFAAGLLSLGCRPEFDDRSSSVRRLRVLAVQSEPAETTPGRPVTYRALVVDDQSTIGGLSLDWAFCSRPRPLDEPNSVAISCFRRDAEWIHPIAIGESASGQIPANACRQFGSDVPEAKPGEAPGRPADPDPTGGYYQPVRIILDTETKPVLTLGQTRLICGLPGAVREVTETFRRRYRPNANPTIGDVLLVRGAAPESLPYEGDPTRSVTVAPGETVRLRVSWPECPVSTSCGDGVCGLDEDATSCKEDCTTPKTCGGAEEFLYYDLITRDLVKRRESMRVSWFANGGAFDEDRTGRDEADPATSIDNTWTAPKSPGPVRIWVVLRDARGGVDFRALRIDVQ